MTPEEIELRHLGQDLHLFLRLAATHFNSSKDLEVISKLNELATQYAHGVDIWNRKEAS
jgi:hypothetical protein